MDDVIVSDVMRLGTKVDEERKRRRRKEKEERKGRFLGFFCYRFQREAEC